MRYRHQTLPLLYILLLGCATLAPSLRTETSPCHHSLPSSVFCFKKSICWNAITPLPGWAFVALSPLFLIDSIPPEALAARLQSCGLEQVLCNLPPGDWAAGERGLGAVPGREEAFARSEERRVGKEWSSR